MPQKPNIVCAKTSSLGLSVYDCTEPQEADHSNPDLILTDHFNLFRHGEFSALAWHPNKEGYILFSDGRTIYLWNVPALYQHKELKPILVHLYHEVISFGN